MFQIAPEPGIAAMLTPSHLRERSLEEAHELVSKHSNSSGRVPVKSERLVSLVTRLTALMLQVKVRNKTFSQLFSLTCQTIFFL